MEMQFDAQRIASDQDGVWLCLRVRDITAAIGFVMKAKGLYTAKLSKYRKKRSNDANAYFWELCGKLAAETRIPKEEIYRNLVREIGDNFEIIPIRDKAVDTFCKNWGDGKLGWVTDNLGPSKLPGYTNICAYYGSSTYDTEQMSRLIDLAVQECKQQDIETMTPLELARMKEEWGRASGD